MSELPEYRRPWWHRWAGLLGEPRRRCRGMDERERFQAGIVLRVVLLGVLGYATSWPRALLVVVIFAVQYTLQYIPDVYAWARRAAIPKLVLLVVVWHPFYSVTYL